MKKMFLLAAAALVAFASCSKSDVEKAAETKAIGFNSYSGRTVTKAGSSFTTEGTLPVGQGFGVYAYLTTSNTAFTSAAATAANLFMNNVAVTYSATPATDPAKYTYSPEKYWPRDESNYLSFFAYYPVASGSGITPATAGFGGYEFAAKYAAADAPSAMVDFMLSDVANDKTYTNAVYNSTKGVVQMNFHHMLTMVKFFVNTDKDYKTSSYTVIKVKSVTLAGIYTENTVTPTYATGTTTFAWGTTPSNPQTYTIYPAGTDLDLSSTGTTAVGLPTNVLAADSYLMLPQTLTNDAVVTITYTVQSGSDAAVENVATVKLNEALVGSTPLTAWEMNKNIKYTFTIGLKPIQFVATVDNWDAEQSSVIPIN